MRSCLVFCCAFLSSCAFTASASTLHIAQSGTFGSATTSTPYSVSGGTFTMSYEVDANPVLTGFSTGAYYEVATSNFSYTLNGISVAAANPGILFFSLGEGGGLGICFSYPCAASDVFMMQGADFYSGTVSAPTLLAGIYTPTSASFGDDFLASTSDVVITDVVVTPEPSSLALLGTGMLAAACVVKRRFA